MFRTMKKKLKSSGTNAKSMVLISATEEIKAFSKSRTLTKVGNF